MSESIALQALLDAGLATAVHGDATTLVNGVRHDSRKVEAGDLFFALQGEVFDGADYAQHAIARGAVAVASESPRVMPVPVVQVEQGLVALARVAQLLYGDPTRTLPTVGITGTNGKTTVSYLLETVLSAAGKAPAVIGTVSVRGPGGTLPATHTTPMADDLLRHAQWAQQTGAGALVLEVSSHALAMHRVDGVHFAAAAFTNLSQDHLDYHGDIESYTLAKYRLFDELAPKVAVINVDDAAGRRLARRHQGTILRCSFQPDAEAELRAVDVESGRHGISARILTPEGEVPLSSPLIGRHNLENMLVAIGCAMGLGVSAATAAEALASATGAPGRLERVPCPGDCLVFVDYAHTPDALRRVCAALRRLTQGRLVVVFGCGGDRDRTKRMPMGCAVAEAADVAIVTSDNPRTEDPERIIADIVPGLEAGGLGRATATAPERGQFVCDADRGSAIARGFDLLREGDTLLIAGKGHETYQVIGSERLPFDDRAVAAAAIAARRGEGA